MSKILIDEATVKLAMEALQEVYFGSRSAKHDEAITAVREALAEQPAQQEPVAWPAGLIERIKAAEQRIQDGHAPRRIPADPTDVDLVLAEVRYLLEGKQPPFWVHTSPPAQRKPLTDEQKEKVWGDHFDGSTDFNSFCSIAEHVEAAHNIKENT